MRSNGPGWPTASAALPCPVSSRSHGGQTTPGSKERSIWSTPRSSTLRSRPWPMRSGSRVEMPYGERRAHALVGLARYYLQHQADVPTGRLGRPHIVVLVDLETLEARAGGSALLASGAVISGDQARRLAEDANVTRVITRGRSEPLDVGRSTRSIPPAIAKAVIVRDRHCRYRGCAAPPWACDVHHRRPWARGGPTAVHNLGLLCWHHHEHVHRRGADHLVTAPDGRWMLDLEAEAVAA